MNDDLFTIRSRHRDTTCRSIFGFIKDLAEYEQLSHEVTATEADLHACALRRQAGRRGAASRFAGGEAVGFALFFQNFSTFVGKPGLYLEDLFVRPEWRGTGSAGGCWSQLARIAVERGYGRMEWSVLDWNELALGVYRRIGAPPMDEWTVQRLTGDALRRLARSPRSAQQLRDGLPGDRIAQFRRDLGERLQHERSLAKSRMRHDQSVLGDDPIPNRIRSRSSVLGAPGNGRSRPRSRSMASSAASRSARRGLRSSDSGGVQKRRLEARHAHGFGLEQQTMLEICQEVPETVAREREVGQRDRRDSSRSRPRQ